MHHFKNIKKLSFTIICIILVCISYFAGSIKHTEATIMAILIGSILGPIGSIIIGILVLILTLYYFKI